MKVIVFIQSSYGIMARCAIDFDHMLLVCHCLIEFEMFRALFVKIVSLSANCGLFDHY